MNKIAIEFIYFTMILLLFGCGSSTSLESMQPYTFELNKLNTKFDDREKWLKILHWSDKCESQFQQQADYRREQDWGGITIYEVEDSKYVILVHCWLGPYWSLNELFLLHTNVETPIVDQLRLKQIVRDENGVFQEQYITEIYGSYPDFDENTQTLVNLVKGRGVGGCGYYYAYKFVGDEFVLEEAKYQECGNELVPIEEWKKVY